LIIPHTVGNRTLYLPTKEMLLLDGNKAVSELEQILKSPLQTNGSFPTIMCGDNTGVIFHEAIGHGLEGHRAQGEDDEESNLFKDRLGEQITKKFVNIYDDPTLSEFEGVKLDGYYTYDDEGVKSQRVNLITNGVLKDYLHSRQSAGYFKTKSNGHCRSAPGGIPCSRMGNLIIQSDTNVSYDNLYKELMQECKKQNKNYGLLFVDTGGGWVQPEDAVYNSYPANVFRLYTNGKIERVYGIHVVGSPDDALSNIAGMADKYSARNGECGAESGFIPHATIAPYTFFQNITVNRIPKEAFQKAKSSLFK